MSKSKSTSSPKTTAATTQPRQCDHPDCPQEGLHRAPKAPERLQDYFWFCKAHARDYNEAWNFGRNHGPSDIERMIRESQTGGRPTWPMGLWGRQRAQYDAAWARFTDQFAGPAPHSSSPKHPTLSPQDQQAMQLMGLELPLSASSLKQRYKALAKQWHPDRFAHQGDATPQPDPEAMIKKINQAYARLQQALAESRLPHCD